MITTESALRDAARTIRRNFWRLAAAIAGLIGPVWIVALFLLVTWVWREEESSAPSDAAIGACVLAVAVVATLAYVMAQAAAQVVTVDHLRGRKPRLGRALRVVFRHSVPIVGAALLGAAGYLLGLSLLIVPGLIFISGIALCFPAIMFEDLGPVAGLKRSWTLTKGYRLSVFISFLAVYLLTYLVATPLGLAIGAMESVDESSALYLIALFLGAFGTGVIYLISIMGYCVLPAIFYVRIKEEREGVDVGALAAVFE